MRVIIIICSACFRCFFTAIAATAILIKIGLGSLSQDLQELFVKMKDSLLLSVFNTQCNPAPTVIKGNSLLQRSSMGSAPFFQRSSIICRYFLTSHRHLCCLKCSTLVALLSKIFVNLSHPPSSLTMWVLFSSHKSRSSPTILRLFLVLIIFSTTL